MIRFPENASTPTTPWPTPALETGYLTFGCCNNIAKLTPTTLKLWAKVLHAVPNSRLLLELAGLEQSTLSHKLLADFAALDVPAERLQLIHRDRAWQYRRYQQIDIALDPSRPTAAPPAATCCGWACHWSPSAANALSHAWAPACCTPSATRNGSPTPQKNMCRSPSGWQRMCRR